MIREDRDPQFWNAIIKHPDVAPLVAFGQDIDLAKVLDNPWVTPLRAERGGFVFFRLDGLGKVHELHTMFLPEAWGSREILLGAKAAFAFMFAHDADLIVTNEVAGNPRSQPPRSFRFEPCGPFAHAPAIDAEVRTWVLHRSAWEASPACLRMSA